MSQTNGKGHVSVDVIEAPDETRSFYDSTNPILAAPKAEPKSSKGWKRKLIGWNIKLRLFLWIPNLTFVRLLNCMNGRYSDFIRP